MLLKPSLTFITLFLGFSLASQAGEPAITYKCTNAQNKNFSLTIYSNSLYFRNVQSALYLYKDEVSMTTNYDQTTEVLFNNDDLDLIIPKSFYTLEKEGMIRLTDYQNNSYTQLFCQFEKAETVDFREF